MNVLLSSIKAVVDECKQQENELLGCGEAFNVFELCGVNHYELMHSKIIAEFLSPTGKHGFSDGFLKLFFGLWKCADWFGRDTVVRREVSAAIEGVTIGRFDILVEDKTTSSVCIIENKIYANERSEQLSRYGCWLKQCQYKNCKLIFLTPEGRKATTATQESPYCQMSYAKVNAEIPSIVSWFEQCHELAKAQDRPYVAEAIHQYINHIKGVLIGGRYMNNKICEVMSKRLYEAQLIYENYAMACANRVCQLIVEIVKKIDRAKILDNNGIDFGRTERGVDVSIPLDGGEAVTVFVGFEGTGFSGFFVGIQADTFYGEGHQLTDDELGKWKERSQIKCKCFESNKWWPIYCYVDFNESADADEVDTTVWNGAFFSWLDFDVSRAENVREKVAGKIKDVVAVAGEVLKCKCGSLSC